MLLLFFVGGFVFVVLEIRFKVLNAQNPFNENIKFKSNTSVFNVSYHNWYMGEGKVNNYNAQKQITMRT